MKDVFIHTIRFAFRTLARERYYSLIKVLGLALGFGTSLVLFLYVSHQLSYDTFYPNVAQLYRINQTNIWDPAGGTFSSTGPAVASALKQDFPEIDAVLRINAPRAQMIRYEPRGGEVKAFMEEKVLAADSNFFAFFNLPLKEGNPEKALSGINKVVLSEEAAFRLFGKESALGKVILVGDRRIPVQVSGVAQRLPDNMHFQFDYLLSLYTNPAIKNFEWSWIWTQVVTYVRLKPHADAEALSDKLVHFADRHAPATFQKLQMNYEEFIKTKGKWSLYIQPVQDIHLYSRRIGNRIGPVGDIQHVYVLGGVAFFILLLAVVNFVNLSTARGAQRAKEVGVKKTLGLSKRDLVTQFQTEHILLTMVAMLIGLAVMELLRLMIQPVIGLAIPLQEDQYVMLGLVVVALTLCVGFLAGLYPSLYLTSFKPGEVLKGRLFSGFRSSNLRNALVVFQFTISIALMASTLIVFQQLRFFQQADLGLNKDNLLVINFADKLGDQAESFRDEVINYPGVVNASLSMDVRGGNEDIFSREGDDAQYSLSLYKIDEHFIQNTGIVIAAGRAFDAANPADKNKVIINETAAHALGWSAEEALGKKITYIGDEAGPQEVLGVVKDFHFQSLRQNIAPLIFFHLHSTMWGYDRVLLIRYESGNAKELLTTLKKRWNELAEDTPFSYSFYDEEVNMQYEQEQRLGAMFTLFTVLSLTIAVIGLIGLVAYSAEQRRKEIGIRKVLGATLSNVYVMINREYVKLLFISFLIAIPLTWYAMTQWLETYAYKINLSPWTFAFAGLIEVAIALLCVGILAIKAASLNPASVLKEE